MLKIKEFTKKYRNYILVFLTIVITCLMYFNYLKGHFSTETYCVAQGYKNYAINAYIADGRLFSGILLLLADIVNLPIMWLIRISVFLGICFASFAILKLKNTLLKLIDLTVKQEIITWIIGTLVIINFVMIELLHFPEACIMALSILMYVLASSFFIEKKYIRTFLFLLLGIFCYQGTIGFFVVLSSLFLIIKYKKICKNECIEFIKLAIITIIAAALNLLFIKGITSIFQINQNKVFNIGIESIMNNMNFIFENCYEIITENCDLFPKNILVIYVDLLVVLSLVTMIIEKNERILLKVIVLISISLISSFALFTIQKGSFFTGRMYFCIGAMLGTIMMYLYTSTNIKNTKVMSIILYLIIGSYLVINVFNVIQVTNEHKIANEFEKNECIKIMKLIEEHEAENNIKVEKIAPIYTSKLKYKGFSDEVTRHTIVTYNNVRHYFGYAGIINYYLNEYGVQTLKGVGINKDSQNIYKEYIENTGKEYGEIVCIGDTLYCPQYIY